MSAPPFEPRRFGAYTLEAKLGHGGMAEVFRANREGVAGFARACVVKRILGHHNEDPSFVDMFINEAKIASKLTHPNIVQVYELGQVDGEFFIAMEYVNGRDLLRVLRELAQTRPNDPAIPPALSAYIIRETCRALAHAHDHTDERGQPRPIIHRDVSPQNIMISFDGVVKLVDFGIAKALGSMRDETRTGALKGKFAYMAPEQIAGQTPGPSMDIFSTGVVLHEMLTGRRLFKGTSDYDTLNKVRSMPVPAPSSIHPGVPRELDEIVLRALDRDRNTRYQKASLMARELDGYLQTMRFSVEEMAEYMRELFPAGPAEPTTGDNITKQYNIGSRTGSRAGSRAGITSGDPTPVTGSGMMPRGSYSEHRPTSTGTGGKRTFVLVAGVTVAFAAVLLFMFRHGPAEPGHGAASEPSVAPTVKAAPEVVQLPQEMRVVTIHSEPSHAAVYDGPRRIGEAPFELKLPVDSPGMTVTLVHAGRADLSYLVRPSDAPEITLRLQPAAQPAAPPPPSHPHPHSATIAHPTAAPPKPAAKSAKPKVETFDDSPRPTPTQRPKVEAIDDDG